MARPRRSEIRVSPSQVKQNEPLAPYKPEIWVWLHLVLSELLFTQVLLHASPKRALFSQRLHRQEKGRWIKRIRLKSSESCCWERSGGGFLSSGDLTIQTKPQIWSFRGRERRMRYRMWERRIVRILYHHLWSKRSQQTVKLQWTPDRTKHTRKNKPQHELMKCADKSERKLISSEHTESTLQRNNYTLNTI